MAAETSADTAPAVDERLKQESLFTRLMKRPELGAIAGVILVTIFFLFTADGAMFTLAGVMNFMTPAAQLGILAIGAALLMIGGEFDLAVGSMIAFTGLFFGELVADPERLLAWHTLFMVMTMYVVSRGVKSGLEKNRDGDVALHEEACVASHSENLREK